MRTVPNSENSNQWTLETNSMFYFVITTNFRTPSFCWKNVIAVVMIFPQGIDFLLYPQYSQRFIPEGSVKI